MPDVLAPGVLDGLTVCVAGDGAAERERLAILGARVVTVDGDLADEDALALAVGALGAIDLLVVDAASLFFAAGGGVPGLRVAIDDAWNVVRAVANASWIEPERPGKAILVAPEATAAEHADAVGAALENTARTLSVEWARFGIRTTAIRPRAGATDADRAELVAFLASPAGDYFSGCAFAPGGAGTA